MMTTLKCERCGRPAKLQKQTIEAKADGHYTRKVYERTCVCGGDIKPVME